MDIKQIVTQYIQENNIKMKSKKYFVVKNILMIIGIVLVSLVIFFIFSLIGFVVRIHSMQTLPQMGVKGIGMFLLALPWALIITIIVLIILVEWFVKRFKFVYRRPIIYSICIILLLVIIGGFIMDRVGVHPRMHERGFYRGMERHDMHPGIIQELGERGFMLKKIDNQTYGVEVLPDTKLIRIKTFIIGDQVMVVGREKNRIITAQAIMRRMK